MRVKISAISYLILACLIGTFPVLLGGCQLFARQSAPPASLIFEMEEDENTDIYFLDLNSKHRVNLTNHPDWDGTPRWSPDGSQIVFASDREGSPDLYVINADGTDVRRLTTWDSAELMPSWSPDGTRIAFASDHSYNERRRGGTLTVEAGLEIWIVDVDGSNPTRVTGDPNDVAIYPTWSPDGLQLLYQNISTQVDIVATDLLSRIPRNLTEGTDRASWTPAWSPTENLILLMGEDGPNKEIYMMDQHGGNVRNLTNHSAADVDPAWSADGTEVVFVSDRTGTAEIFVLTLEGETLRQITDDGLLHARPAWRPVP